MTKTAHFYFTWNCGWYGGVFSGVTSQHIRFNPWLNQGFSVQNLYVPTMSVWVSSTLSHWYECEYE